jgi:hypothetical protein
MLPRRTLLLTLLSLFLFSAGAFVHLHVGRFPPATTIYGDKGDGLFNLWVLEHVHRNAPQGWQALSDGRILHPVPNSYWRSDNLLVPALLYSLPRALGADTFRAYAWTVWILAALGFAATLALFAELRRDIPCPAWTGLLPPVFAFIVCFSQASLKNHMHFQNLASVFWICLLLALLRFLRSNATRDLLGIVLSMLFLLASAPYYALLGAGLLGVGGLALLANHHRHPLPALLRQLPVVLPFALVWVLLVLPYLHSETRDIPLATLRRSALSAEHLITPLSGWIRNLAPWGPWPRLHPGGYPGAGLLIACVLCLGWALFHHRRLLQKRIVWIPVILFLLSFVKVREIRPFVGWFRLALFAVVALYGLATRKPSPKQLRLFVLIASAVFVWGTAMGPGRHFSDTHFEPNVWGLFSRLLPGYGSMRELIRFAPLAHLLALALVFRAFLSVATSRTALVLLVLLTGLQLSENIGTHAVVSPVDPAHLGLDEAEHAFFETLDGVMFIVPAAPFHRNTQHMLRWMTYENLRLINGYSGSSTPELDALIAAENHHGRVSPEQVAAAIAQGADFLCVLRHYVPDPAEEQVRRSFPRLFENDRFLVVALRAHTEAGESEVVTNGVLRTDAGVGGGDAPGRFAVGLAAPREAKQP